MPNFTKDEFTAGQMIFNAGDPATNLWVLETGDIEWIDASGQVVGTLTQGQSFGEAAMLIGGIRTEGARAKTDVVCKSISNKDALALIKSYSPLLVVIMEAMLLQWSMNNAIKKTLS